MSATNLASVKLEIDVESSPGPFSCPVSSYTLTASRKRLGRLLKRDQDITVVLLARKRSDGTCTSIAWAVGQSLKQTDVEVVHRILRMLHDWAQLFVITYLRPHHKAGLKCKYQTCSRFAIASVDRFTLNSRFDIPVSNLHCAINPAYDEAC